MNFLILSLILIGSSGAAFSFFNGADLITGSSSALLAVVSIMAAAILVRLNRGIPTVDWKSVDRDALTNLLDRLEQIALAYIVTFVIALLAIILVISGMMVNSGDYAHKKLILEIIATVFGATFGLLMSRMGYIVWLDLDIVRLQRVVIISAAEAVEVEIQKKIAEEKTKKIRQARITPL